MAEQFIQNTYYASTRKKYVDIYRSINASIEWWISKLLFHDDLKRIVYATQDIAFRKRIETLDKGKNDEAPLKAEMLDLPFATYSQVGDVEPDDRPAAVNAGESVDGVYFADEDRLMRSLAVMIKYKVVCFFSRRDDVQVAQQLTMWEQEPKSPIWLYSNVIWRNMKIDIPTFITVDNINTNPDYKETDWLTKNKIFPMEIELTVRTYQLLINNVDKIIQLPIRFSKYKDTFEEDDPKETFLTEEVVLQWAAEKFDINIDEKDVDTENEDYRLFSPYFVEKQVTIPEQIASCIKVPNEYTTDIIRGYWERDTSCVLNAYKYDEIKSTSNRARIAFKIKPDTFQYFDRMVIYVPTKKPVKITDCHSTEAYIENLYPNSTYKATLTVYATDGTLANYFLTFTTKNSEDNFAPQPEKINKVNGLVGMRF